MNTQREKDIEEIRNFPLKLENLTSNITEEILDSQYRVGSWTIRQSIHHLLDSHTHSYVRIKFALTEENPSVSPYNEKDWAMLYDTTNAPVRPTLQALKGLHFRISYLLVALTEVQWKRTLFQPELGQVDLIFYIHRFANHCRSHYKIIEDFLNRE